MGTVKQLLEIALGEVGTVESPPHSNKVKYNTWYYGREVSGNEYPWCMVFCQWVFHQAGVKLPVRTASCTEMLTQAKRHNAYVNRNHLRPGDLVLFDFKETLNSAQHCGIIKTVNGIKMEVIEGNTGFTNDTDGGRVMIRQRTINQSIGAFRPKFDDEEDLDMTKEQFLRSLSDKEAYELLEKARKYAASQAEPKWSKDEGHWKNATDKKIVDGRPEDLIKRDEVIAILGRNGLIR